MDKEQIEVQENGHLALVSEHLLKLSMPLKHKLFALWMNKERIEGSKTLDLMLYLDKEWESKYQEHRVKDGFSVANLFANEHILIIVYGR